MSRHRTAASPAFGLRLTRTLLAIQAVPVAFFFALRLASLDASSTRHTFGWRAIAGISSGAHFGGTARTGACLAIGCRSYPCRRRTVLNLENGVCRVWRLPTVDSFPTFFFASNLLFVAWLLVAFSVFEIATVSFESVRGLATRIPVFEDCEIPGGPSVAFAFVACVPPGV